MILRSIRWKPAATFADRKIARALIAQHGGVPFHVGGSKWRIAWPIGYRGD